MIQFKDRHATVFQSALYQTTSTVMQTDDLILVVDPNWLPQEIQAIRHHLDELQAERQRPVFLLFTHSDYDHVIGYRAFPEAKVIASKALAQNPDKQAVLEQMLTWDDENYVERSYPIEYPQVDFLIEKDGQTLAVGGTKLTFYLAPGHTEDGIFTLVEPAGVWLAGDYLCEVEFPYVYFSCKAYEATLAKVDSILARHEVRLLVPGHGKVATERAEILTRKNEALGYLAELRQRVAEGRDFDVEKLWRRYRFPRSMRKFHEENVALMRNERSD